MGQSFIHRLPSQPTIIGQPPGKTPAKPKQNGNAFAEALNKAAGTQSNLSISKHADMRMQQRNINIEETTWHEIGAKIDEAKRKGVNDSLVLLKNAAMIVSAKNRTVVTVMDRQEAGKQIFTNIDGTIVID